MMNIIDFDALFFNYARQWMKDHPGLNEEQIENSYNDMMRDWIDRPDPKLDGAAPSNYFDRYTTGEELIELMRGYHMANVILPEPLYTRIVEASAETAPLLQTIVEDDTQEEAIRTEAMSMLREMGDKRCDAYLVELVCTAEERGELSDLAADILSDRDRTEIAGLMDRYEAAPEYAKQLILDIECNFPGDPRVTNALIYRLKNRPEERALTASLLKKLGDPAALEALEGMLKLYELRYYDYLEIRDAIEALGGEVTEERTFYGDPDFEALRGLE